MIARDFRASCSSRTPHSKKMAAAKLAFTAFVCIATGLSCAGKKKSEPVTLKELQNKKVALVNIEGAQESHTQIEIAVINEILDHGRFEIIDRTTMQDATVLYPTEGDWQRLGKKVGADYLLSLKITEFSVTDKKGYDAITEEDSTLTEESGESTPVVGTRYVKVKSSHGTVRLTGSFFDVEKNAVLYQNTGSASATYDSRDKDMPRKMVILEKLSRQALTDFFQKMP